MQSHRLQRTRGKNEAEGRSCIYIYIDKGSYSQVEGGNGKVGC